MTRLITDGAEMGDVLFWDAQSGVNVLGSAPSGSYKYWFEADISWASKNFVATPEVYVRGRIATSSVSNDGDSYYYLIPALYSGSTNVIWLTHAVGSSGNLVVKTAAGVIATGPVMLTDTWYLLEAYFKIADSGGRCVVKLDGVIEIDFTGDTKGGTETTVNKILWRNSGQVVGEPYLYLDDFALNDTNGDYDNSWCGDGRVELIKPNAEGDLLQWTPSTGTTHWSLVDDIPSNSDTDYVYAVGAGLQDRFNLADFVSTNKIVDRVWVDARAKDNSAGSGQMKVGFKTGSTVYLQTTAVTLPSIYTAVTGDMTRLNPATGLAWTESDLDGLQVVVESET